MAGYLATGHPWEALFENWEREFLQMAVFVLLTTFLIQKGSPESRRPGVKELVDADPRDFAGDPDAPWPVRRGGWLLRLYEHSLGLAFVLLFLIAWVGHALGGFAEYAADEVMHQQQRWSPESKLVHAPHAETGRWRATTPAGADRGDVLRRSTSHAVKPMNRTAEIRIGTAGWSIPRAAALRFDSPGTHLQRYSRRLDCAEINSSFYRPHSAATYAKWRDSTPPHFRFAVKMPRAITHELQLRDAQEPFVAFLAQTDGLAEKRGPLLLQLPPSLSFDAPVVTAFLDVVRQVYGGPIVCEPRHATWFSPPVTSLLERYRISRVAADPPPVSGAARPGGWPRLVYFRLHGSPRTYWSRYDEHAIETLAVRIGGLSTAEQVWCVFDNTASGAAIENAWELRERLIVNRPPG